MKFGSLFAGISGFDLGFERAGMTCEWQVEIDKFCNGLLEKRWPKVKRYGDVRKCGRHNLNSVELICGGFPCQDVSVAGRRKGLAGDKSGLWFEFYRVLKELRPRWVVIENVPGLLFSNKGRDFVTILQGLAELRYLSAWRILDAQYFGVAQRRRRVFIIGHLGDGRAAEVLFEPTCGPRDTTPSRETREDIAGFAVSGFGEYREGLPGLRVGGGHDSQGLVAWSIRTAHTKANENNRWWKEQTPPLYGTQPVAVGFLRGTEYYVRRLTPTECERLQGFPDGFTADQSDTRRYKQLGNAVCVPVAEWLGRRIMQFK